MKQLSPIQLQQQIIHYKSELHKYQQKCRELEKRTAIKKISVLQNELSSLKIENQRLIRTVTDWEKRCKEASDTTEYQAVVIKRLQSDYHQLQVNFNLLKELYIKRKDTIDINKKKEEENSIIVNTMQMELQKFEEIGTAYQVELEYINEENRTMKKKLNKLEKTLYHMEMELFETNSKAESDSQLFNSVLNWTKSKTASLKSELNELQILKESLTKKLHDLQDNYIEEKRKVIELKRLVEKEKKMRMELAVSLKQFKNKIIQWKELMRFENSGNDSAGIEISLNEEKAYVEIIKQLQKTNTKLMEEINRLKRK
jgi:chromosome segregation ATPase